MSDNLPMTDRELLEMAAKAAGIDLDWEVPAGLSERQRARYSPWAFTGHGEDRCASHQWNPLTDDGDAFRLAVKLQMDVMTPAPTSDKRGPCASTVFPSQSNFDAHSEWLSDHAGDACAATRRAIVRAAAEIGKG